MDYYSYIEQGTPRLADSWLKRTYNKTVSTGKRAVDEVIRFPKDTAYEIGRLPNDTFNTAMNVGTQAADYTLGVLEKVGDPILKILDATLTGLTGPQVAASEFPPQQRQQNNNTILYVGIGVAALGLVYYLQTKK